MITVAAKIWIFESEATIKARARCWSVARTVTWHPLLHHHGICKKAERAGTSIIPECERWMSHGCLQCLVSSCFFYRWCRFADASESLWWLLFRVGWKYWNNFDRCAQSWFQSAWSYSQIIGYHDSSTRWSQLLHIRHFNFSEWAENSDIQFF